MTPPGNSLPFVFFHRILPDFCVILFFFSRNDGRLERIILFGGFVDWRISGLGQGEFIGAYIVFESKALRLKPRSLLPRGGIDV